MSTSVVFLAPPKVLEGVAEEEDKEAETSEDLLAPNLLFKEEEETPELKVSSTISLLLDVVFFYRTDGYIFNVKNVVSDWRVG